MTLSFWLDNPAESVDVRQKQHADVVIVGGGIIGAGCAYLLSSRTDLKVVLLESGSLASGGAGRNAGFVLRGIQSYYNQAVKHYGRERAQQVYRLAEKNQQMLEAFASEFGGESFGYERCGSYLLASSLDELQDLSESAALMKEDGFELDFLKSDPLDRDFYGAIYNPGDVGVNPAGYVKALVCASTATILEGERVRRMETTEAGVEVRTNLRSIECSKVLLCTNAYSSLLDTWFIDKIQPARGQALVTAPLKKRILEKLGYANYGFEYFRQLADNRLLVGGCRQNFLEEEVGFSDMVTTPVQSALENYIKDKFPEAAGVPIEYRWSGVMAYTNDGLPIMGEHQLYPGVFYAIGCNGHGLSYGLALCELLLAAVFEQAPAGPFDSDRASLKQKERFAIETREKGR